MLEYKFIHWSGAELKFWADSEEIALDRFDALVTNPSSWTCDDEESNDVYHDRDLEGEQ